MTDRRRKPSPNPSPTTAPPSSGPRCFKLAVMRSSAPRSPAPTYPAMPHMLVRVRVPAPPRPPFESRRREDDDERVDWETVARERFVAAEIALEAADAVQDDG